MSYSGAAEAPASSVSDAADARSVRLARNIVVLLVAQAAIWIAGSGLGILLPRFFGDANIGRLTFAYSLTGFFGVLILFGCEPYLAREVARRPEAAPHMTFNALIIKIPLMLLSVAGAVAFVHVFDYPDITRRIVYVFSAGMCLTAVGNTLVATLQGLERMTLTSSAAVLERMLSGVLGVGAVALAGMGLTEYALILLATSGLTTLIVCGYFVRTVGLSYRLDVEMCRELLRGGAPFLLWSIALLVYATIDITMLSLMTSDQVVGWYGTAYRFIGIATFFPSAITMALLPNVSRGGIAESRALIRRCLNLAMLISFGITVFFLVGASAIIDFLGYPEGFRHTVLLLRILSLHIPLTTFGMIAGTVVIASHREGARTKAAIIAAILNPLMNLAAIPYFQHSTGDGAIGAAITSVIIEVFMTSVMFALVPKDVFDKSNINNILRSLVAALAMAAGMLIAASYGLIPMTVLGGACLATTAVAVGAVSIGEMRGALQTITQRH